MKKRTHYIKYNDKLSTTESVYSEEVQMIIERMPIYWVKWIAFCVIFLMAIILSLSFLIQYPDTVDGQISVTAIDAPVRLVANNSGRLILLQIDKVQIRKGDIISYIDNGANFEHILWVDSVLTNFNEKENLILPDAMLLGEVSSAYNAFMASYFQFRRFVNSNLFSVIIKNLQFQIESDKKIVENLNKELLLKTSIIKDSEHQLKNDSLLFVKGVISEQSFQQQRAVHLAILESNLNIQSTQLSKLSVISNNIMEIQRLQLEHDENLEKAYSEFIIQKNSLSNAINIWKERYLQLSPIDGELEYLGFWRNNCFVKSGQELYSIIPEKNNFLGEVVIPSYGAGKVKISQAVNVKINNYPHDEFGVIKGQVISVSRISNKIETKNGVSDAYLVVISFPNGNKTNFGKYLPLDYDSKGTAEIITKPRKLIERLFESLNSKREK